jgi:hypothetical protein
MSAQATYRRRDLETAVAVVRKAGIDIRLIEIDAAGKITITTGKPAEPETKPANAFDGAEF